MQNGELKLRFVPQTELDIQKEYCKKVAALLDERYGKKPLACVVTYGCQQNVADSERLKGMLFEMGYGFTDDRFSAQLIIFNTCAVREHAEDRVFGNVGALKPIKESKNNNDDRAQEVYWKNRKQPNQNCNYQYAD